MKKWFISIFQLTIFVILLQGFSRVSAQNEKTTGINWMGIEEAVNKSAIEPRKLMVYIYSDNCGWCRKMNNESFSEPVISKYINEHLNYIQYSDQFQLKTCQ